METSEFLPLFDKDAAMLWTHDGIKSQLKKIEEDIDSFMYMAGMNLLHAIERGVIERDVVEQNPHKAYNWLAKTRPWMTTLDAFLTEELVYGLGTSDGEECIFALIDERQRRAKILSRVAEYIFNTRVSLQF